MLTPNVHSIGRPTNDYDRAVVHIKILEAQLQRQEEISSTLDKDLCIMVKRLKDLTEYVKGCEKQIESQQIFINAMRGEKK